MIIIVFLFLNHDIRKLLQFLSVLPAHCYKRQQTSISWRTSHNKTVHKTENAGGLKA